MAFNISPKQSAHRTAASSYRIPAPPHIFIPPHNLNNELDSDITLIPLRSSLFSNCDKAKTIPSKRSNLEWTYLQRREAQSVLSYLYLGPMTSAKDEAWLKREEITCVLGVRQKGVIQSKLMNGALRKAEELGLQQHAIDVGSNQDLIKAFPHMTALIYEHVAQRLQDTGQLGKVLVFCESGNDRSAGVVAAFLMDMHENIDYVKAMQLCQAQRFCVSFDDSMKRLLQGYWDIICARREVDIEGARDAAQTSGKRELERDDDMEMNDSMGEDDRERFGGRSFVPFTDREL